MMTLPPPLAASLARLAALAVAPPPALTRREAARLAAAQAEMIHRRLDVLYAPGRPASRPRPDDPATRPRDASRGIPGAFPNVERTMAIEWRDTTWHRDDEPPCRGPETHEATAGGLLLVVNMGHPGDTLMGWVVPLADDPFPLKATDLDAAKAEVVAAARRLIDPIHALLHEGDA